MHYTANTMVIGETLHTEEDKVVSISFRSGVAEHFLHLNASEMLESVRYRKATWDADVKVPVLTRKLRTVYVPEKKIKVRLYIHALPNETASPKSYW